MPVSNTPKFSSDNVMEFRTSECKPFKVLFDALKENINDVSIYFNSERMFIYSLDTGRTVLINVELDSDEFDHYYCRRELNDQKQEVPLELTVSVHNVNRVLKTITGDDDTLVWWYNPSNDHMTIVISSSSKNEQRSYEIKLQEPEDEDDAGAVDGISNYSYALTMPCEDFQRICKDLRGMNVTTLTIKHQENHLIFSSKSDIANTSIVRKGIEGDLDQENENSLVFCKVPSDTSCYSDDFKFESFFNFSKCASIGSKTGKIVQILLNPEQPAILIFKVGKLGKILFVMAPLTPEDN